MNKKTQTATDNVITDMELLFGEVSFILNETQMESIIDNYNALKAVNITIEGKDKVIQVAESDYNNG